MHLWRTISLSKDFIFELNIGSTNVTDKKS